MKGNLLTCHCLLQISCSELSTFTQVSQHVSRGCGATRMILLPWLTHQPVHPRRPSLSNLDLRTSDWNRNSLRHPHTQFPTQSGKTSPEKGIALPWSLRVALMPGKLRDPWVGSRHWLGIQLLGASDEMSPYKLSSLHPAVGQASSHASYGSGRPPVTPVFPIIRHLSKAPGLKQIHSQ